MLHDANAFPIILDAAGQIHVRVSVLTCPQAAPTPTEFDLTLDGTSISNPDPSRCGAGPMPLRYFGFGSQHDQSVNFAFAGESVRPINRSINRSLLRLLAMRADSTPIPSEF